MRLLIAVVTNGRSRLLTDTLGSAGEHLLIPMGWEIRKVIVDDSGSPDNRAALVRTYGRSSRWNFDFRWVDREPAGLDRAMQTVFEYVRGSNADYVFHLEDDFVFRRTISVASMAAILQDNPGLAQVALLRQAWYANEVEHGGVVKALQAQGQEFTGHPTADGAGYIRHRACFTLNPCLYPAWVAHHPWPDGDWSETRFGKLLFADPGVSCAYYGNGLTEHVEHIGVERVGVRY